MFVEFIKIISNFGSWNHKTLEAFYFEMFVVGPLKNPICTFALGCHTSLDKGIIWI